MRFTIILAITFWFLLRHKYPLQQKSVDYKIQAEGFHPRLFVAMHYLIYNTLATAALEGNWELLHRSHLYKRCALE